jgi:hypothetical protein
MSWSQWFAPVICDRFPLVGQWSPASCVEAVKCQRTSAKRNRDGVHLLRMLSSSRRGVVRADRLKVDVAGMMRSRAHDCKNVERDPRFEAVESGKRL